METDHQGIARDGRFVDLSRGPRVPTRLEHPARSWNRTSRASSTWTIGLASGILSEVMEAVERMRRAPLPLILRQPKEYRLPACRQLMAQVKSRLCGDFGLVVLDGLPMEHLEPEE